MLDGKMFPIRSPEDVFHYRRAPYLVMIFSGISDSPETGRRFALDKDEWTIGSEIRDDIQLAAQVAAPYHACLKYKSDKWYINNTKSRREIFANGLLVSNRYIQDGDVLTIGTAIFKFFSGVGPNSLYDHTMYERTIIDPLTGIYDRGFFDQSIIRDFKRCFRQQQPISLLIMDLDKFKDINTRYGLQGGDEVLRQITRRIYKSRVREDEILARYGGEELVLILPGANIEQASDIAEQIRKLIENTTIIFKEQNIQITVSIGVSSIDLDEMKLGLDEQELINRASARVNRAKELGRNRVIATM